MHLIAQKSVEPDVRLLEIYPQVKLDYMLQNNPMDIALLNFKLDNAYFIEDISNISLNEITVSNVTIDDINNFNFFSLKLIPLNNARSYYSILGTDKLLIVKSDNEIITEFKSVLKK
jgi:hypothetical protein